MNRLFELGRRLRMLLRGRKFDRELDEEMRLHRELREREERATGATESEASYVAQRKFGNALQLRESGREMWRWNWAEEFLQDVRYGLRLLRKNPGFTAVAVLTLALGIGANAAIFSLIDTVMLRMLPVQKPEELVRLVYRSPQTGNQPQGIFTNPLWEQIRDHQDVFSGVFANGWTKFDLAQGGESHNVHAMYVSGDFFNTLGVRPAAGRLIASSDDKRGCSGVVVLSDGFWQEHFGGAETAVGSMLTLSGHSLQVIGVSAPDFFGVIVGEKFDVAVPLCTEAIFNAKHPMLDQRSSWWLAVMGRPKDGIGPKQLAARLQVLSPGIFAAAARQTDSPERQKAFAKSMLATTPGGIGISYLRSEFDKPLKTLMVVVGLVLLIACANIASLMLARAAGRRKEMSIRLAVGASRSRLIRQLLTECILLSSAGALLGVLFARWACPLLVRLIAAANRPGFLQISLDGPILGFTAGIAVLTGLLFGALPALRATRVPLTSAMKGGVNEGREGWGRIRPGKWIVVSQIAISFVLLIVAGLFLQSFRSLLNLDAGFDRSNVLLVSADTANANVPQDRLAALYEQILDRLRTLPGAISASDSVLTPISGSGWNNSFHLEGAGGPSGEDASAQLNYVSPGYFATLRSPILAGRDFDEGDSAGAPFVAIIDQSMAGRFFPHSDPVGKFLWIEGVEPGEKSPAVQIVGVLKDTKYGSLREDYSPTIYFPIAQLIKPVGVMSGTPTFEIRTTSRPSSLARAAEVAITGVNKAISLEFKTLETQVNDSLRQERMLATLSGFFGGLALILAMIGLYGVLAYMVTQRRKEIGIRMALGAGRGSIHWLILRDVSVMLLAGIGAGLGISMWATQLFQKMLFGMKAYDSQTILMAGSVLVAVALFAGYLPARRASRVDPISTLRNE